MGVIQNKVDPVVHKWGIVFVVDLIASVFTYSLLETNQLVNRYDGLWHVSESVAAGHELSIGRWLWRYLDKARFHLSPDPITSVFALTIFIVSIIIVMDVFEVRGKLRQIAISMLFLVSVSICTLLSYRYMSLTFAFAMLFSVAAFYALARFKNRYISAGVSALCIALCNGCYQAFTGIFCLLILLYIALCIGKEKKTDRELAFFTIKSAVSAILGSVLYYVLLKIELVRHGVTLDSYNGASEYGIIGIITNLPSRFLTTYHDFYQYFHNDYFRINVLSYFRWVYFALFVLILVLLFTRLDEIVKTGIGKAVVYVVCILLTPVACNVSLLIAYNSFTSIQMTAPMAFSLSVLLCLVASVTEEHKLFYKICHYIIWITSVVLLYTQFYMVQYDQQAMYMGRQSCFTMAEQIDAYLFKHDLMQPGYKYVIVGSPSENKEFYQNDFFRTANSYAQFGRFTSEPKGAYLSWQGLWWYEKGIRMDFAPSEKWAEIYEDENIKLMPHFPDEGSCAYYKDVVVIHLAD